MATTYIPAYKGYITDVPKLWFKRRDGKVFHYDQLTAASMTPQVNFTEVNAGWSLFPVAYLPGQSTMEMQATSGQFNADMFAMANNVNFAETEYDVPYTVIAVPENNVVTLKTDYSIKDALTIAGLEMAAEAGAGKFTVAEVAPAESETQYTTTITLTDAMAEVEITYYEKVTTPNVNITNQTSAVGELIAKWPVYATGDETDAAGVKGYVLLKIYKCRVTAMPGFDTSYKGAATNSVTFSAMDAKRADEAAYNIAYVQK